MKLAILSESSADDIAIKILIDAIIGKETELVSPHPRYEFKTRGWPQVLQLLQPFFAHWYKTDAEAVVIVVDSDDDSIHEPAHEEDGSREERCRYCLIQRKIEEVHSRITLPDSRERMKIAIGIATPAIEAWLYCLEDSHVNEVAWLRKLKGEKVGYDRPSLKKNVYGSGRNERDKQEKIAAASRKLASNLEQLEQLFPQGFGAMAREIHNWQETNK